MTYVNISIVQKIYDKNVSPFLAPYLKGQPLFLGIDRKVLSDRDRQDEQFFSMTYVNISMVQQIYAENVSPFLAPYLKGQTLFLGIDRKVLSFPTSFVQ